MLNMTLNTTRYSCWFGGQIQYICDTGRFFYRIPLERVYHYWVDISSLISQCDHVLPQWWLYFIWPILSFWCVVSGDLALHWLSRERGFLRVNRLLVMVANYSVVLMRTSGRGSLGISRIESTVPLKFAINLHGKFWTSDGFVQCIISGPEVIKTSIWLQNAMLRAIHQDIFASVCFRGMIFDLKRTSNADVSGVKADRNLNMWGDDK